ncbi:MAG: TatD family hydrolase, partial [Erysipelotrichaceae bacterium]
MAGIIDTHAHITCDELFERADEIIENAKRNGVEKILAISFTREQCEKAIALSNKYPGMIDIAVGLFPVDMQDLTKQDFEELEVLAQDDHVVAIGEIGLDYYWTKENTDKQKEVFNKMLQIAIDFELPVIIHNRNATKDVYEMVKKSRVTGVLHCFSGSIESANDFIKIGF